LPQWISAIAIPKLSVAGLQPAWFTPCPFLGAGCPKLSCFRLSAWQWEQKIN